MEPQLILQPICALVLVTFFVWMWMFATRIPAIQRSRTDLQEMAIASRSDEILKNVVNPSDNSENLLELPVLFYVAMIGLYSTKLTDSYYLYAAWAFVFFRALHSFIHCTSNRIMHRFSAYFVGSLVLWAIWIRIGIQLI